MDKASSSRIKKRKTRKCLNELRKKSRLCSSVAPNFVETNICDGPNKRTVAGSHGNKVTKNRLTMKLGIFSKGVRSETITRPQLSEEFKARMDENLYKIIDLANGKPSHTITSGAYEELTRTNGTRLHEQVSGASLQSINKSHVLQPIINVENANSNSPLPQHSPGTSPMCFTPPNQGISKTFPQRPNSFLNGDRSEDHIISVGSSSETKDSPVDEELYQYFRDFMADVPKYLNTHFPELMDDDTYESTREYLQRVHTRSCERVSDDNVQDCIVKDGHQSRKKSILEETMEQSILLNPIEYIKHYEQQGYNPKEYFTTATIPAIPHYNTTFGARNNLSHCTDDLSVVGDNGAHLSMSCSPDVMNSAASDSSHSSIRMSAGNHCVASFIEGSPEIRFYPRKLNP